MPGRCQDVAPNGSPQRKTRDAAALLQKYSAFFNMNGTERSPQVIEPKLRSTIYGHGRGWVFTPAALAALDDRRAIVMALIRKGVVRQLARDLYDYPVDHPQPSINRSSRMQVLGISIIASSQARRLASEGCSSTRSPTLPPGCWPPRRCVRTDVGVEDDHRGRRPIGGGSRIGSRAGNSRSARAAGATRARMAAVRSRGVSASTMTRRRMSRASSSMERPCSAAHTRRRCLISSSRLRMVLLATASLSQIEVHAHCKH